MKSSPFFKSFMVLASGSILAQVITILISPLTTRLFTSTEIGEYTLILSFVNLFAPILSMRYDYMIIPEKSEDKTYALVKLCLLLGIGLSFIISIGYSLYSILYNGRSQLIFTIFLFILLSVNSFINVLTAYNNKNKEYKTISTTYVIRTTMQNIFLVFFGIIKTGSIGLILSQVIGTVFGVKKQGENLYKNRKKLALITREQIYSTAVQYKKQPLIATPAAFLNTFSYNSINFMIDYFFSKSVLGLYSISYRVLGLPLTLISNNVSKVYFETASSEYKEYGNFINSFYKIIKYLTPVSIVMMIVLMSLGPTIFSIVFGKDWLNAGKMVQILAPMFSIKLISTTLGPSIWIKQKQKYDMIFQLLLILSIIISISCTFFMNLDVYSFLFIYSISNSFVYLYSIYIHYTLARGR